MAKMTAPGNAQGLLYNGANIAAGSEVDVLDRDVDDLVAAGWSTSSPTTPTVASLIPDFPTDPERDEL